MRPAVALGLAVAATAAAAVLGARVERARARRTIQDNLDLYEADRARGHADCIAKPGDGDLAAAWAAGYQAHEQRDEARLVMAEVERRQREVGGGRS